MNVDSFWARVDRRGEDECWPWLGSLTKLNGHGKVVVPERSTTTAHRVAYELLVGPIPKGMHLDHLCRNRVCCNPAHLEPVTPAENTRRGISFAVENAAKTHCPSGHPYDEANTRWYQGRRYCRACTNNAGASYRRRKAEASSS